MINKKHKLAIKVLFALLLLAATIYFIRSAEAKCWHCNVEQGPPGPPGMDGADGLDGDDYLNDIDAWSDDDLSEMFTASIAIAGIDFDSTTSKLQLGVALGGYGSERQGAIGIGKVLDNKNFGDILVSFKTTFEEVGQKDNEHRPWVAAATWKIQID